MEVVRSRRRAAARGPATHATSFRAGGDAFRDAATVWELPPTTASRRLAMNVFEAFTATTDATSEIMRARRGGGRVAFADARTLRDPDHADARPGRRTDAPSRRWSSRTPRRARPVAGSADGSPSRARARAPWAPAPPVPDTVYFCVVTARATRVRSSTATTTASALDRARRVRVHAATAGCTILSRHVNCVGPKKRPYHTIIPGLATRTDTGDLYCAFGVMGGNHAAAGPLAGAEQHGGPRMDPQAALDHPRWCLRAWGASAARGPCWTRCWASRRPATVRMTGSGRGDVPRRSTAERVDAERARAVGRGQIIVAGRARRALGRQTRGGRVRVGVVRMQTRRRDDRDGAFGTER